MHVILLGAKKIINFWCILLTLCCTTGVVINPFNLLTKSFKTIKLQEYHYQHIDVPFLSKISHASTIAKIVSLCIYIICTFSTISYHLYSLGVTVMFSNRTYSVIESAGPAQPVLVLSNPSSMNITVEVRDAGGTATSEWTDIVIININSNLTQVVRIMVLEYTLL